MGGEPFKRSGAGGYEGEGDCPPTHLKCYEGGYEGGGADVWCSGKSLEYETYKAIHRGGMGSRGSWVNVGWCRSGELLIGIRF